MSEKKANGSSLSIALIAHDNKKSDMIEFCGEYLSCLKRHSLIATGTTGKRIRESTGLDIQCKLSGPLGGDAQIASEVAEENMLAVIFFIDGLNAQPHEPDIQALVRICGVYDVPIATNRATAGHIMNSLKMDWTEQ